VRAELYRTKKGATGTLGSSYSQRVCTGGIVSYCSPAGWPGLCTNRRLTDFYSVVGPTSRPPPSPPSPVRWWRAGKNQGVRDTGKVESPIALVRRHLPRTLIREEGRMAGRPVSSSFDPLRSVMGPRRMLALPRPRKCTCAEMREDESIPTYVHRQCKARQTYAHCSPRLWWPRLRPHMRPPTPCAPQASRFGLSVAWAPRCSAADRAPLLHGSLMATLILIEAMRLEDVLANSPTESASCPFPCRAHATAWGSRTPLLRWLAPLLLTWAALNAGVLVRVIPHFLRASAFTVRNGLMGRHVPRLLRRCGGLCGGAAGALACIRCCKTGPRARRPTRPLLSGLHELFSSFHSPPPPVR